MKRNFTLIALFATLFLISSCRPLSTKKMSVERLIDEMTLWEKLEFIGGYNGFYIRGIKRLGIPEIRMADGPLGVRNPGPSTAFPAGIALAASFNKNLASEVGAAIGREARSKNVHVMLGPARIFTGLLFAVEILNTWVKTPV